MKFKLLYGLKDGKLLLISNAKKDLNVDVYVLPVIAP